MSFKTSIIKTICKRVLIDFNGQPRTVWFTGSDGPKALSEGYIDLQREVIGINSFTIGFETPTGTFNLNITVSDTLEFQRVSDVTASLIYSLSIRGDGEADDWTVGLVDECLVTAAGHF